MAQRRACVTGGSRGIGRAIAVALTAAGMDVTVLGRTASSLEAVVASGHAATARVLDVTDGAALGAAVRDGAFDVLVNNAGGAESAPFLKAGDDAFARLFALNVGSAVAATRAALPHMVERGFGRVINVASTAGLKGYAYVSAYVTAKHALVGLTRALAVEFARTGVTVNALCPGYTDTDLVAAGVDTLVARTGRTVEQARAHFEASNPMGRLMRPEEVADAALWLVGSAAGAVTGQAIVLAGGEL